MPPPPRTTIKCYRHKNLSLVASAVLFTFLSFGAQAASTWAKVNGTVTINGETIEVVSDGGKIDVGNIGDVIAIEADKTAIYASGTDQFITINGTSITANTTSKDTLAAQSGSTISVGSAEANYVSLSGQASGIKATKSSTVVVDTGNTIQIAVESKNNADLYAVYAATNSNVTVGQNAEYIYLHAEGLANSTSKTVSGIRAESQGKITVGSELAQEISISASHSNSSAGLRFLDDKVNSNTLISVTGQKINVTSRSGKEALGLAAYHGGDIRLSGGAVTLTTESTGTKSGSSAIGIEAYSDQSDLTEITLDAKSITSTTTANIEAIGAYAGVNSVVTLGSTESELVSIKAISTQSTDNSRAFGLWVDNTANLEKNGGKLNIQGQTVSIYAEGANDTRAIHVASNDLTPVDRSQLSITADNIFIEAKSTDVNKQAVGISAMSAGEVSITGNTFITAEKAILARGDAEVVINKDGQHTTQIDGDIVFAYDAETSGTGIDATIDITLAGAESYLEGQSLKTGEPPADKSEVKNFSMKLTDGGTWRVTGDSFINTMSLEDSGSVALQEQANTFLADNLTMDGGIIRTSVATQKVTVNKMKIGNNSASFEAASVLNQDGTISTAQLSVGTLNEESADNPSAIKINYTGITSDQLTSENVKDLSAVTVADGSTLTKTENVAEGNIKGAWTRTTTADGKTTEGYSENTKLSSYSSITAMSLVQWRNEINHLTKRLGDIRASESTIGAWARVYGGASEWGSNPEVDMDHTTIQVGGDYRVSPNWIVGGAFSYTDSDAESSNGFADGKSYSLAAYATYLADNGSFLDMIARYGYLKNDITAGNMALETKNNAFSLSVEGGHQFRFIEDRAYIEPQIALTYGFVSGDDADASNSVRIEQDDYQNLITRVGVRTGFDFPEKAGTIYATLSYSYDFLGDADGTASGQTEAGYESVALTEDLGGGWVTYGIGAQFRLGDNAFAYGELERTSGGDIDNPYLFNVGFRYNF